jgi:polysaccharide export outer membrane protein
MTRFGKRSRRVLTSTPPRWCIVVILLTSLAGCRQGVYRASALPAEFWAPAVGSAQSLDLSRLASASARSEVIQPGDVLHVSITTGLEVNEPIKWPLRVGNDGAVNVPLVGLVRVAGLDPINADFAIGDASVRRGIYRAPQVAVQVAARHSNQVFVTGAVVNPGVYPLPSVSSDLLAALVAAGGLTEDAGTIVEIRHPPAGGPGMSTAAGAPDFELAGYRGGPQDPTMPRTVRVDLQEAAAGAGGDFHVEDGSVVMVMKKPLRVVYVMGLVHKANQFEMPPDQDLRMLDALALAGGRTMEIADKVRVIRNNPHGGEPVVIDASVREAKRNSSANIRLAAGDVVSVEETSLTFTLDTVRNFLRFGFTSAIPGL